MAMQGLKKINYHKSPVEGIYYMFLGRYPGQAHTCEPAFRHAADALLAPSTLLFVVSAGWPGILGCVSGAVSSMSFTTAHPSHASATASIPRWLLQSETHPQSHVLTQQPCFNSAARVLQQLHESEFSPLWIWGQWGTHLLTRVIWLNASAFEVHIKINTGSYETGTTQFQA